MIARITYQLSKKNDVGNLSDYKEKQDSNNAIFYFVISLKCNFVTLLRWYIRLQKYEKDFNLFVIVKMVFTSADKSQNEM